LPVGVRGKIEIGPHDPRPNALIFGQARSWCSRMARGRRQFSRNPSSSETPQGSAIAAALERNDHAIAHAGLFLKAGFRDPPDGCSDRAGRNDHIFLAARGKRKLPPGVEFAEDRPVRSQALRLGTTQGAIFPIAAPKHFRPRTRISPSFGKLELPAPAESCRTEPFRRRENG